MKFEIKISDLCNYMWQNRGVNSDKLCERIIDDFKIQNISEVNKKKIKIQLQTNFISRFNRNWKMCHRIKSKFYQKHSEWLKTSLVFYLSSNYKQATRQPGRPKKDYVNITARSKRRRIQKLRNTYTQEEISDAVIKHKRAVNNKELIRNKVLALYMDMGLTRSKYNVLRNFNVNNGISNEKFPSYGEVLKAKIDCYPFNIEIADNFVKINLQAIMDHTICRLVLSFNTEQLSKINNRDLILTCKWGMDGASGQQNVKQNFQNPSTNDSSVFAVMFVPLQLSYCNEVIWINQRSSSTRLCRPISFEFVKETSSHTLQTYNFYKNEIQNLKATILENVRDISCAVTYSFQCTMVDGKTINTLTDQKSSASCNVCRATPKQMNNLSIVHSLPCNEQTFEFGLSPLHCRIRFMECILHIAYNLDFKTSCARGDNKNLKIARKYYIQKNLKEKLSLTVDVVKQGMFLLHSIFFIFVSFYSNTQ